MLLETKLCNRMGYPHCVLFSRARVAIAWYRRWFFRETPLFIPSNVCPSLANALGNPILLPVDAANGLSEPTSDLIVQLYGCRKMAAGHLEIDPLMTGWEREPWRTPATSTIISFGYSKTIDIGYGAALLTTDPYVAKTMRDKGDWHRDDKTEQLDYELDRLDEVIKRRKERLALWNVYLPKWCIKPDIEPVMPWRVIRRIKGGSRDYVAMRMRQAGLNFGINYPPLPGCTDPSSVRWGEEVCNFWLDDDPVAAREVLNRAGGL